MEHAERKVDEATEPVFILKGVHVLIESLLSSGSIE
jgi:hypothetical protein